MASFCVPTTHPFKEAGLLVGDRILSRAEARRVRRSASTGRVRDEQVLAREPRILEIVLGQDDWLPLQSDAVREDIEVLIRHHQGQVLAGKPEDHWFVGVLPDDTRSKRSAIMREEDHPLSFHSTCLSTRTSPRNAARQCPKKKSSLLVTGDSNPSNKKS